jgi:hypothetical protein
MTEPKSTREKRRDEKKENRWEVRFVSQKMRGVFSSEIPVVPVPTGTYLVGKCEKRNKKKRKNVKEPKKDER